MQTAACVNRHIRILQCHGSADPLVKPAIGAATNLVLRTFNADNTRMKTYPDMGHAACDEELRDIHAFIVECVP